MGKLDYKPPKLQELKERLEECKRNVKDFKRGKNLYSEGYYQGYYEALMWAITGEK